MSESWLILETSGRAGAVGLARGGAVVRSARLDDARRLARDLAATVDGFLKAEGLAPADLTGVMVSRGPGSYTGLRVGVTSAKALAYATGCRLAAVDTFAAVAFQAPAEAADLWVTADALQGQVYIQRFCRAGGGAWAPVDRLRIVAAGEWLPAAAGAWVSGPGVKAYEDRLPAGSRPVPEADRDPRVESVLAAGLALAPVTRAELFALEPLYLRGSSAEEKAGKG